MLTLTENASTIVKDLASQTVGSEAGGLRIASQDRSDGGFAVAVVEVPEPGDTVVETSGARVYLTEEAALALDDKTLDAALDQSGSVKFQLVSQG